ncbi:hypothetical protein AB0Q95_44855 [Streptomyces sp. NPDC059900]|uniref:hypothetical protein n=1 Tax=Streptomyces sp. NPDC059900 TaxID=3155816 RepID=UPI003448E5B6
MLTQWRVHLSVDQVSTLADVSAVDPYAIYAPGGRGLIGWGSTEWADEQFWLIDAERPGEYLILARSDDGGARHRYDLSTSEFLYRLLADAAFQPFGIAQYDLATTFEPGSRTPSKAGHSDEGSSVRQSQPRLDGSVSVGGVSGVGRQERLQRLRSTTGTPYPS